jgi:hypothetical protein
MRSICSHSQRLKLPLCAPLSFPRTDSSISRAGSDFAGQTAQPLRCAF